MRTLHIHVGWGFPRKANELKAGPRNTGRNPILQ
jgi:hypothetical protein